jgi:transcriptional regulator GlxA family with amidase domain
MILRQLALALLLTTAIAAQEPAPAKKLGILVFPGVQVIDFTGPYEVLKGAHAGPRLLFDVVTVGISDDEFRASPGNSGIRMLADHTVDDCPKLDILVIPGEGPSLEGHADGRESAGESLDCGGAPGAGPRTARGPRRRT